MNGTICVAGVGPGDPELMTLKAVRVIREADVIAVPGTDAEKSAAYRIAAAAVPEIADKELLPINMPMTGDLEALRAEHEKGARLIESVLKKGRKVVYLTLGDPSIYCTFSYLHHILEADGFSVQMISGIPSFCAAAARLDLYLAEWDEALQIIPAAHGVPAAGSAKENLVFMKSGRHMKEVREFLDREDYTACAVENCGMETEKVYRSVQEIPEDAGYFSLVIAKRSARLRGR